MKRALLGTLWIGVFAAGVALGLQLAGVLVRPNTWLAQTFSLTMNNFASFGYLLVVIVLSFLTAWVMLLVPEITRRLLLLLLLTSELIGAAWLLNFPPLPAVIAVGLATFLAIAVGFTRSARRRRANARLFRARLSAAAGARLAKSEALDLSEPLLREASFVFCEIANEAELIDELPPADCAARIRELIDLASDHFLKAGGYLHAADGEGIRVLFGFPQKNEQHAIESARAALGFRESFHAAASAKPESLGKIDLRIGISSGTIVATLRDELSGGEIVLSGEPLEIGRRLARANQVYGSQILLGPLTFNAAGREILARPIDFLPNTEAHERLEVYELLALSEEATPEEVARRDRFWTAVVYFRERRWNEALAEFNRARSDGESDPPLQWYLHRLESLCLQVATEPASVAEPLVPLR